MGVEKRAKERINTFPIPLQLSLKAFSLFELHSMFFLRSFLMTDADSVAFYSFSSILLINIVYWLFICTALSDSIQLIDQKLHTHTHTHRKNESFLIG